MKKLLIATDCFEPRWDGITRFLSEIIPRLKDYYSITVLAPNFPGKSTKIKGARVVRLSLLGINIGDFNPVSLSVRNIAAIKKEVRKADIVWTQTIGSVGFTALRTADEYRKPLVSFVHSIEWDLIRMAMSRHNILKRPLSLIARWIARNLYNRCDMIIVPSLEVRERLEIHKIEPRKIVAPLGTDTTVFKPALNKGEAKKNLGLSPEMRVVGYCGRIAREKDIRTLLRAFLRLKAKRNDVVLLLVGSGVSDYESTIKAHKEIIAVGNQNDVVPYLQAMDVYVLPSLLETSSLSTMEAMACEVPVICTPVGLVRNYVKDKENGYFFKRGNAFVLSMKLDNILSQPELRREMGRRARCTILDKLTWDRTAEKIRKVLERC